MAINPLDYTAVNQVPRTGMADFGAGVNLGVGLGNVQVARTAEIEAQALAAQQREAQQKAQQQLQRELVELSMNPNTESLRATILRNPQLADPFKEIAKGLTEEERDTRLSQFTRAQAAVQAGQPEMAAANLERDAEAYARSGRERDAQGMRDFAKLIRTNQGAAQVTMASAIAGIVGPENLEKTLTGLSVLNATADKAAADADKAKAEASIKSTEADFAPRQALAQIALTDAQKVETMARAKNYKDRLAFDYAKLAVDSAAEVAKLEQEAGKLPPDVFKAVSESSLAAQAARGSSATAAGLALKLEQAASGGFGSRAGEWLKRFVGSEDELSAIRRSYEDLVARNVIASLPPGTASDTDIALVKGGFPPSTADSATLGKFLRSLSNVQAAEALAKSDETEFLGRNRSLGPARVPLVINGVQIPAGMTYNQFSETRGKARQALSTLNSETTPQERAQDSE